MEETNYLINISWLLVALCDNHLSALSNDIMINVANKKIKVKKGGATT